MKKLPRRLKTSLKNSETRISWDSQGAFDQNPTLFSNGAWPSSYLLPCRVYLPAVRDLNRAHPEVPIHGSFT
ncbi:Uncharacterized protein TCM_000282 [Theobroma cacao]|uniref:Uncharacterized protein n=1 Tax=Theobroma cacao TaxID=3641 RepID=A0A061DFF7_THECC|nr:Uncharacterized protein TCM_000282 [Theobroma cacao]